MSYSDPQSWEDVDAGGNACDWTTRKNKLLYPAYEMLRLALVERCQASNTTIPTILDDTNPVGHNELVSYAWKTAYQSTITTLIPKFVNHTDSGGNWDGQSSIPNWTETTILAAIDPAEIRIPATYIFSAVWEIQQYKILNLLRWFMGSKWLGDYSVDGRQKVSNYRSTYQEAMDNFNITPWSSYSAAQLNYSSGTKYGGIYIEMSDYKMKLPVNGLADVYAMGHLASQFEHTAWWDFGVLKENALSLVLNDASGVTNYILASHLFAPPYPPAPTSVNQYQMHEQRYTEGVVLIKFTGPNGFKFRDW